MAVGRGGRRNHPFEKTGASRLHGERARVGSLDAELDQLTVVTGRAALARAHARSPMTDHVLITGGAGLIGSHLADELIRQGHRVRALDDPSPHVASSRSVYGEGPYRTARGALVTGASRALGQIERRDWTDAAGWAPSVRLRDGVACLCAFLRDTGIGVAA